MQKLFLTFFGVGLLKPAPGTWGSIAGAVIALPILFYIGDQTLFMASILLFLASIKIINDYESKTNEHDQSHIVIDEVAGVWLAMAISGASWTQIILSIAFFRLLDITKPSIIGRIDKNVKGGLGVMGDDMVAGLFAGLLSAISYKLITSF
ncbi:phosphatidylglycerophosphatase A [Campylobacter iguaniorum]|uniref:Phosphatidylglycerophosphatase A n=1 Tax=Campylobacter iguaniorum TaxID=1244531 RepID=A0A076F8K9_9BACT|nr:phosphatidylglycerophosphatase A [Campylobacter iguaniorum]AII14331.1 phosphatidylglycerophosphatase A [Campylobacter iguaniorum]ALV24066.1 phosphatidylglycerophosphatase A [Campylobacter iguaniorum]